MTNKSNNKHNTANSESTDSEKIKEKPWMSPDYPTLDNYDESEFEIEDTVLEEYTGKAKDVKIPYGVTSIGYSAFNDAGDITSVVIPDSVTDIKNSVFCGCQSLTSIIVAQGNPKYHSFGNCLIDTESKALIAGCKNSVIPADGSVITIEDFAFRGFSGLTSITIPKGVKSINSFAFMDCSGITSITIPDSVTDIESGAFAGCSGLTSISVAQGNPKYHSSGDCIIDTQSEALILGCQNSVIPTDESVTTIGSGAFAGCSGLTSITISDNIMKIEPAAFAGCSGLTGFSVAQGNTEYYCSGGCLIETESKTLIAGCKNSIIPTDGSVTRIEDYAFCGCVDLTSVTIPDSITSIGSSAFADCEKVIQTENGVKYVNKWAVGCDVSISSLTLRDGTIGIGDCAFSFCQYLTSVTIPNNVARIGRSAFCFCTMLKSITLPDGIKRIEERMFQYCVSLRNITIPKSVKSIGDSAFIRCISLTNITIPDGVTSIGYSAFSDCRNLTSITIPKSVKKIGWWAFQKCYKLTIYCKAKEKPYSWGIYWNAGSPVIWGYTKRGAANTRSSDTETTGEKPWLSPNYPTLENYDRSKCEIEGTVLKKYNRKAKHAEIPYGVTLIDENAFADRGELTSVVIPDSVTSIGNYAFSGCSKLSSVTIPDSVTSIGELAFCHCLGLTSITIPAGVAIIEEMAFSECSGLTSIRVNKGNRRYRSLGNCLIDIKSKLLIAGCKNSIIPADGRVTSIGKAAFCGCSDLVGIIIPDSVKSIGGLAFCECSGLRRIVIPKGVTSVGNWAFKDCDIIKIYCEAKEQPSGWNRMWNPDDRPVEWREGV